MMPVCAILTGGWNAHYNVRHQQTKRAPRGLSGSWVAAAASYVGLLRLACHGVK
jgi:hypothetical protein